MTLGDDNAPGAVTLQRSSLMEQALKVLRQRMVTGEIRSGELYSVSQVAQQLGTSNSPVREAMLSLVNEGLMEAVRNRGYRVVPLTQGDLQEIVEIRSLLEIPMTVRVAREHAAEAARFRPLAEEIVAAARRGDVIGYLESDRAFHLGLLGLLGNDRATKLVGNLRDQTRLSGLVGLNERLELTSSAEEHLAIIDAIVAGDEAETAELMRRHLGHITHEWSEGTPV